MKDDSARRQRVRAAAGARLEIIFNYNYDKIYNNITITNYNSAARHDSCSGGRRTKCHRSIHFLERVHHVRHFPAAPPFVSSIPFETCAKITCTIFYDIIIDSCNLFQHSAAERPAPFACPALITFLLAFPLRWLLCN